MAEQKQTISKDEAIEIAMEQGGSRDEMEAEEEATETEAAPEPTKPTNQLKVVIIVQDANILL